MRLLAQAHPAPEVVRVDAELALDDDDVGRDQREAADACAVRRAPLLLRVAVAVHAVRRETALARLQEQLALAEHPGRHTRG